MFERLNAFGETVGKPTERPTSRIGQNNQRQVGVLYGHQGGGRVYNYLAGEGVRSGDIVTPTVTHPKSGKTYKTLGRVTNTRDALGGAAGDTAAHLAGQGILMKTLGPTDQTSLPGFEARKAQDPSFTARQWAQEAKAKYDNEIMQRFKITTGSGES
jgi:hypothetical protein